MSHRKNPIPTPVSYYPLLAIAAGSSNVLPDTVESQEVV